MITHNINDRLFVLDFGFNIIGGIDQPFCPGLGGVFISKIKKNGPAEKSGNLHVGDLIKEVNYWKIKSLF